MFDLLDEMQDEDGSIGSGQLRQGRQQYLPIVILGRLAGARNRLREFIQRKRFATIYKSVGAVEQDFIHPGAEFVWFFQMGQFSVDFDERFLHDFLSVVPVLTNSTAAAEGFVFITLVNFAEGGDVALLCPADELGQSIPFIKRIFKP